jgi:hypothetical protein
MLENETKRETEEKRQKMMGQKICPNVISQRRQKSGNSNRKEGKTILH